MTVYLTPTYGAGWQGLDGSGNPLNAGKLYTYQANTTSPLATYTTVVGNVQNSNPITLNSDGRPPSEIWGQEGYSYKVLLTDAAGNTIETRDNLPGINYSSFIQAGTGAVTRTAQAKMRDIVSVADFGAVGDGTTDDTTAIQSAITAVTSPGGMLFFPRGTYKTTSALAIVSQMLLFGADGGAVIAPNFATGDVMTITGLVGNAGVTLDGLTFNASVTRTANAYVNIVSSYYTVIQNCQLINGYSGILMSGSATTGLRIRNCRMGNNTNYNIAITAQTGTQGSVDLMIEDIWMHGTSSGVQTTTGLLITSAGDIVLRHINAIWSGDGLNISPGNGQIVQAATVVDSFFDTGSGYGVSIQPSGTGEVQLLKLANTWAASNTLGGMIIGGTGLTKQTDIINGTISGNTNVGLLLDTNATNVSVIGGSYSGNSTHGIAVVAGTSKFKITGATIGASGQFSANGGWGILVNAGASDNYVITGNYLTGNSSGNISDGGTGQNKFVQGNPGYVATPIGQLSNIPIGAVAYNALGTAVSHVAGTIYVAEIYISTPRTITGIGILNAGTVGTSLGIVALYGPDGGAALATSALAGAASVGANVFQNYAFTAALTVQNPGRYFIAFQANNATDNIRCIAASTYLNFTKSTAGVFGTISSLTVPTSTTADVGPIGYLY